MLRAILGVFSIVISSALMWMNPNATPLVFWGEVGFLLVGFAVLLDVARDTYRYLQPAQRIYRSGILEREQRIVKSIDALRKNPFIVSVKYDPRKKIIEGNIGIPRTWDWYAITAVLWLANRRLLTHSVTIWLGERLGWPYTGEADE